MLSNASVSRLSFILVKLKNSQKFRTICFFNISMNIYSIYIYYIWSKRAWKRLSRKKRSAFMEARINFGKRKRKTMLKKQNKKQKNIVLPALLVKFDVDINYFLISANTPWEHRGKPSKPQLSTVIIIIIIFVLWRKQNNRISVAMATASRMLTWTLSKIYCHDEMKQFSKVPELCTPKNDSIHITQ